MSITLEVDGASLKMKHWKPIVLCALLMIQSGCASQYLGEKTKKRPVLNAKTGKMEEKVQNPELYALLPLAIGVDVASAPILTLMYIATIVRDWRWR